MRIYIWIDENGETKANYSPPPLEEIIAAVIEYFELSTIYNEDMQEIKVGD